MIQKLLTSSVKTISTRQEIVIFAENSRVRLRTTEIYHNPRTTHLLFSCRVFYLCRSTLIVTIHKAQLKEYPTDQDTSVSYYVKLKILPLNHRSFQTEAIKEIKNPEFMETFEFHVTYEKLQAQSLKMTLWCFDRFSQHEPLGHHTVHLAELEARGLSLSREILLFRDIYAVQKVKQYNQSWFLEMPIYYETRNALARNL